MSNTKKVALVIGAGPAGLTAAHELLARAHCDVIVVERDPVYVGGISRTVNHKGNRIDIGGHRFFSKSDRVMHWWSAILPVSLPPDSHPTTISYQRSVRALTDGMNTATPEDGIDVFEVRPRKTRIVYQQKFFAYPIELSFDTLAKLGARKTLAIGFTYLSATLFPRRPEKTLEDFFINRFGVELYRTFFKSYTEKVWGTPCNSMSAEWGAQRVKGLSIQKAILHAVKKATSASALSGKQVETSLIEQFLYPPHGPGQVWENVAEKVRALGGDIRMGTDVIGVELKNNTCTAVTVKNREGKEEKIRVDYVFSSTDVGTLSNLLGDAVPVSVKSVAENLEFRDFITVGLLLDKKPEEENGTPLSDTWMYIHDERVHVGRVQLFHNWHPNLVADQNHGWIGMEYFCTVGDALWEKSDAELLALATDELGVVGLARNARVIDGVVIRQPKAYPGYFGAYKDFGVVRSYLDSISNLFPIGRNGMHRYNNQDHSMLAAMTAVDLVVAHDTHKKILWDINTEEEYHEQKN